MKIKISDWPPVSAGYFENYNFACQYYHDSETGIPIKYKNQLVNLAPICEICQMVLDSNLDDIGMGAAVCQCSTKYFEPVVERRLIWLSEEENEALGKEEEDDSWEEYEDEEECRLDDYRRWHRRYKRHY